MANENEELDKGSDPPSPQPTQSNSTYDASNIVVLEGLDGVRKRPSMYIGSQGIKGFHHLATEVIDNSIDEVGAGCTKITVTLNPDNSLTILDNGRGIPTEIHPKKKIPTLEVIFSSLHSGGKFDKKSYAVSGGLHGVGLAVVNACSEWVWIKVWREGKRYELKVGKGKILDPTKEYPATEFPDRTGTEISFYPDPIIFTGMPTDDYKFDFETLSSRLRDLAFLNPIEIELIDARIEEPLHEIYKYENGVSDFVTFLNKNKKTLHAPPIHFIKEKDGVQIELAFQYNESYNELIYSFVNNINTIEGGTHLTGYKSTLTRVFNKYVKSHERDYKVLDGKSLKGSDVREGLVAVLAVKVPEPQFEGQTKTKLGNPEVKAIVSEIVFEELLHYFDAHPTNARQIIQKSVMASKARIASQKARELTRRKSVLDGLRLPGKLADCSSKDPSKSEIFIVEGDSAGGSAKQGRDRGTQAILPLRGKILNVEKARFSKILANKEIAAMIKAFGVGIHQGGSPEDEEDENDNNGITFELEKLRYHKIIILADADVDGHHIETLLLTFFFRYMRPLIDAGHIYLAVPPIYKLSHGKKFKYLYIEDDAKKLAAEIKSFAEMNKISDSTKIKIQRYKGLGEMNPSELWDTTLNPDTRRLNRMKYVDFATTENRFSVLMGDEVAPRREFIMDHYNSVTNLDI
ncbi:MAG: DNA gyrase/topoisomerase IV subunit B [Promethearchaeota archaeon]